MIREIFNLIPTGLQEKIKLHYYNLKIWDVSFSIENNNYHTKRDNWNVLTKSPLYFIVKDVKRYERFYQVSKGDIVVDAGANEGILTLIYSQLVYSNGKVFAFEPDRKNIEKFNDNLDLNKETKNIYLIKKGLWNKKDFIDFYEAGTVGSSFFYERKNSIKKTIPTISIDEFVQENNIEKIDFIKMDIEGAEIEALQGAQKTLKSLKPNLAIASYHIVEKEHTYKKLEAFFEEIKYPFKTIFYEDNEIITYAGKI